MVIRALDLVPRCFTWQDGAIVGGRLCEELEKSAKARLSFEGVGDVPSSFVNGLFGPLLDRHGLDQIRQKLEIVESNAQINDMIRRCLNVLTGGDRAA